MLRVECPIDATKNYMYEVGQSNPVYTHGDWSLYLESPKGEEILQRANPYKVPNVYYLYSPIEMFAVNALLNRSISSAVYTASKLKPHTQRIYAQIYFANGYKYRMSYFLNISDDQVRNYAKIMEGNLIAEVERHGGNNIQDFGILHKDWLNYLFQSTNNETVNDPKERVEA